MVVASSSCYSHLMTLTAGSPQTRCARGRSSSRSWSCCQAPWSLSSGGTPTSVISSTSRWRCCPKRPRRTLRMTALASLTNATLARLSHVVSRLEKKGFVRREPCGEDRRARPTRSSPRPHGRKSLPVPEDTWPPCSETVIDPLTATDVADLDRIMGPHPRGPRPLQRPWPRQTTGEGRPDWAGLSYRPELPA